MNKDEFCKNISKETIIKALNDDIESEYLSILKKSLKQELSKPNNEIDFDNVCEIMYEIIQIENGITEL